MSKPHTGLRALVTGASSGIGAELARQLAQDGADLVLTARREDRLQALAEELRAQHGVQVQVLAADLSVPGSAAALFAQTDGSGVAVDILINNAGFGTQGRFDQIPWSKTAEQLQLNVVTLTELTHLYLVAMKSRGRGWILNVASIGAWLPSPQYATYCAGKAYVRNFTEAVAFEERGSGVVLTCLAPGPTSTEFMDVAGHHDLPAWQQASFQSAADCAAIGLRALFGGRSLVVSGYANTWGMWSTRLAPRRLLAWIGDRFMGRH